MSGFVSVNFTATRAFMDNDKSLFGVGQGLNRAQDTAAIVCSVTGIYVNVKRPKAKGAVVARRVFEWTDLRPAMYADESVVVF